MKNRRVGPFFALVVSLSWLLWLPTVLVNYDLITLPFDTQLYSYATVALGAFMPLIVASVLLAREGGGSSVWAFIRKGFDFRVKSIWIGAGLLLPLLAIMIPYYLTTGLGIQVLPATLLPDDLPVPAIVAAVPYFLFIFLLGGGQEEFGWRGYAQEPLQEKYGVTGASLIIGVVWGVWHLPLWFMPGSDLHNFYPFLGFWLFAIAFSVQLGWLYNASGKKLLVPWLAHAMSNTAMPLFPPFTLEPNTPDPGYWMLVGFNVIVALVLGVWMMRQRQPMLATSD